MRLEDMKVGMTVTHPQYGEGIVQRTSNVDVTILFGNVVQTVDPDLAEELPRQASAEEAPNLPLEQIIESTVESVLRRLGVENPNRVVHELGSRWHNGKMVLHPADPGLQAKEIPLEVLFHKIVGIRNQLRVLEQKVNANEKLTDAEKVDLQQYITRSYGSLTTFNILFRDKEDQFSSKGE